MSQKKDLSELGIRLYEQRRKSHLTHEDVSEKLGVSVTTVYRHESGMRIPTCAHLMDYSKLYNVSPNYLLLGNEDF